MRLFQPKAVLQQSLSECDRVLLESGLAGLMLPSSLIGWIGVDEEVLDSRFGLGVALPPHFRTGAANVKCLKQSGST